MKVSSFNSDLGFDSSLPLTPSHRHFPMLQDGCLHLLSEEAQVLSKVKREAEHHLQIVKTHLQQLDATRKTLKAKVNSFSHSLELDAQNFKVRGRK